MQRFRENASVETELWNITETIVNDLEICKNENRELRQQLKDLMNEDTSISQLYLELQEENVKFKEENRALKFKFNAQKLQLKSEKLDMEKTCEMRVQNLQEEVKRMKQVLQHKEKEFFEELQMAQATAAYEFEKIEQKLKWQLSDIGKQLQESNLINTKLRKQLENLNNENIRHNSMSINIEIPAVRNTENSTEEVTEASINYKQDNQRKSEEVNNFMRTYEPLQIECSSVFDKNTEKQMPPLFKGKSRPPKKIFTYKHEISNISKVPPLIPCSNAASTTQKRRKLYDPDDLSYLTDLISNDN